MQILLFEFDDHNLYWKGLTLIYQIQVILDQWSELNWCHLSTTVLFEFAEYNPCWKGAMSIFQSHVIRTWWRHGDLQINLNLIGVSYWSCYWKELNIISRSYDPKMVSKQSELNYCFLLVMQSRCNEHNPYWKGVITLLSHMILQLLLHHLTWN